MEIELLDSMGGDIDVANAARVSMGKHTDELREKDINLIHFLANNQHWTPFAHVIIKTRIHAPFFVARQWYRHQVGFARNEESRRYVSELPKIWIPDTVRARPEGSIKQGSGEALEYQEAVQKQLFGAETRAIKHYQELLASGVAPEQARAVLPLGAYTQWIETASLYAYARLCRERLDPHAQEEIRNLASRISTICSYTAPHSWYALMGARNGT